MGELLDSPPGARTALEIGCGTGHFTRWLASRGMETMGLDPSTAMLAVARQRSWGIRYVQGTAEELPFADRSFDLAVFVTSLEFVADPQRALREAARVARGWLLLGVLNLASPTGLFRKVRARFRPSPYRHATFYTPWGLERLVRGALAGRVGRIAVRTAVWPLDLLLGASRVPFGAFIGMSVAFRPPVQRAVVRTDLGTWAGGKGS